MKDLVYWKADNCMHRMKILESGMPDEQIWEGFFNPNIILKTLGLDKKITDVAEFGCGYGTFTISAAKMISGKIYAIDLEQSMLDITLKKANDEKLDNVVTVYRDFTIDGSSLVSESVDYVMIFNILHGDKSEKLFEEAFRILKKNGIISIIHWNYDTTPRGPPMDMRLRPEQCIELGVSFGFVEPILYDLKPYHYGIILKKR